MLLIVPFLTGCAGFIPVPTGKTNQPGAEVKRKQAHFIQPGKTTRMEVITRMGTNNLALPGQNALAYSWEGGGVTLITWICLVGPDGGYLDGAEADGWFSWHGFFIAFDDKDVVRAVAFKRLSEKRSLHEHLGRWVASLPKTKTKVP